MKNNQLDSQVENQVEKNLDKNISCNIFFEQINLINQLPIEERGNVLYMAILNAFVKNQDNQLDNQLENAYISISISLSESLSILSKWSNGLTLSFLKFLLERLKSFDLNFLVNTSTVNL